MAQFTSGRSFPIGEIGTFLKAVAQGSLEAAADASNAAALVMVRAIRREMPTRRLQSRAGGVKARPTGGVKSRKRTGTGVNYAYLEADATKAKSRPTALLVGRGPVHLLENTIEPHPIPFQVVRGERGRIRDVVPVTERGSTAAGKRRANRGAGPSLAQVYATSVYRQPHPGVKRTTGPLRRGLRKSRADAQRTWTTTFARRSSEV